MSGRRVFKLSRAARSGAGAALHCAIGTIGIDVERAGGGFDHIARNHHFLDTFQAGQIEHGFEQDALHDRAQAARAGLALDSLAGDRAQGLVGEGQLDIFHFEQPLVLLHQRILRFLQDLLQRGFVEILQRRNHRQATDELRNEAVLQQILRLDLAENLAGATIFRRHHLGGEADRGRPSARRDDLLEPRERTTADEQDVGGVDLQELLLRMLATTLRGNRGDRAFHDLQQRLLHALARHIAGDRGIVGLARDLVDFVDVDDAALRPLDIIVRGLEQLEDDVLDVFADIAGFGQRRCIRHGERHIENARQRLRQQRLARAGRTDQQDVGLRQFDVVVLGLMVQPLVVVVDRDRENLLRMLLADHVIVQHLADFLRRRNSITRLHQRGFVLLANDVHAEFDALIADENGGAGDQFADFVLALPAERAIQGVLRIARTDLAHSYLRLPLDLFWIAIL